MDTQEPLPQIVQQPTLIAAFHESPLSSNVTRPLLSCKIWRYILCIVFIVLLPILFLKVFLSPSLNPIEYFLTILLFLSFFSLPIFYLCIGFYNFCAIKKGRKRIIENPDLYCNETYTYFYNTHFHVNQSGPLISCTSNVPYSDILNVAETIYVIQIRTSDGYHAVFKNDISYNTLDSLRTFLKSTMPAHLYKKS